MWSSLWVLYIAQWTPQVWQIKSGFLPCSCLEISLVSGSFEIQRFIHLLVIHEQHIRSAVLLLRHRHCHCRCFIALQLTDPLSNGEWKQKLKSFLNGDIANVLLHTNSHCLLFFLYNKICYYRSFWKQILPNHMISFEFFKIHH